MPLLHWFDLYLLVVIALIELARALGAPRWRRMIVRVIALTAYHLSAHKRRQIENNLRGVFGDTMEPRVMQDLTRRVFHRYWQETFEWVHTDSQALAVRVRIEGLEHLRAALARGCGVILWESNSFGERL